MSPARLGAFLAAALLGVAAGQAHPGPAAAAGGYCDRGTGVTVVVDNGPLGGGASVGCDPQGAGTPGSTVVPRAGYPLTYVTRQPGFVCRVAGQPASASCGSTPPSDAYWGLFWSDGKSGTWSYSSVGIGSLKVPAGGLIGWRFQGGGSRSDPGPAPVSPSGSTPTPKPSPRPTPKPSSTPTSRPTTSGAGTSGTPTSRATVAASAAGASKPGPSATTGPTKRTGPTSGSKRAGAASAAPSPTDHGSASPTVGATVGAPPPGPSTDAAGASPPDVDLTAGERATGSSPVLPMVAAGLLVVLLGSVGGLAWRRRRG